MNEKPTGHRRIVVGLLLIATLAGAVIFEDLGPHTGLRQVYAVGVVPGSMGPGAGTILIHEFGSLDSEMTAFEAGSLDIVDWPVPAPFLSAWTGSDSSRNIATQRNVTLSKYSDLGMFQIDLNSNRTSTTGRAGFRRALAYLVDRQQIVNIIAGGQAVPICAGTAPVQPGAKSCTQLGYPTPYGDFNPSKALQTLYEDGWRDNCDSSGCGPGHSNGILETPFGVEETLTFIIRNDDPIRYQAGLMLANQMGNLPNHLTNGTIVCSATPVCKISVSPEVMDNTSAVSIVFGPPWNDWHLYTGGWNLGFDPDHLYYFYTSSFAPLACGGARPGGSPTNYLCYVDAGYDAAASGMVFGRTYSDVVASAQATQDYAWGYNSTTGRIRGTVPTIPLYSLAGQKAAWITDHGATPLFNPDGTRASWAGFVTQDVGTGLDNYYTMTGLYLYNGQDAGSSYVSYKGQGTLDWGFKSPVRRLNIVTSSGRWDRMAMDFTYDSLLTRNPVGLQEILPVLAESFGQTTYVNAALGREGTVAAYKLRKGISWSDGQPLTGNDVKFSIEYVAKNFGQNSRLVGDVFNVTLVPNLDGSETVVVFFDRVGTLFAQNAGFLNIIPMHIWCASWPDTTSNCAYPRPSLFPGFQGLGCATCPSGPIQQVGTGPYMITACSGSGCNQTITLKPNPVYKDGTRYWSQAAGISLQPDVDRDGHVTQADLDLLAKTDPSDIRFDVDYRMKSRGNQMIGTVTVPLRGPIIDSTDLYIVQRLVFEGQLTGLCGNPCATGGITWPPSKRMTYTWPDVTRDNSVDLGDLIAVFLHQFQATQPVSGTSIYDVNYDGSIDISDLVITFVRQFNKPAGIS